MIKYIFIFAIFIVIGIILEIDIETVIFGYVTYLVQQW